MFELRVGTAPAEKGMGWLEWSASLVGSLAWPVAAVVIAILFRSQIKALLSKIRKLTWGDKSADFSEQLDKIEDVSREATPSAFANGEPPPAFLSPNLQKLLEIAPSSAIVEAWKPIENFVFTLVKSHDNFRNNPYMDHPMSDKPRFSQPRSLPFEKAMTQLLLAEVIPFNLANTIRKLRKLRNEAAHSESEVTITDALRFIELASSVETELKTIVNPR